MAASPDALFLRVFETLNEAQARWFVAQEAVARGRGGITAMHRLTGMSRPAILRGIRELRGGALGEIAPGRARRTGGGRKRLEEADPGLDAALAAILEETTAGDPMRLLRWTSRSTERIAQELTRQGHRVSAQTVRRRLHTLGYSLQANAKNKESSTPAGRDEQFRYINRLAKRQLRAGDPVLSVDTKKKERVGEFKNPGKTWLPKGKAIEVNVFDYPHLGEGIAVPYGTYDVGRNEGFVSVGRSADTAEFAVQAIRSWWRLAGSRHYPKASSLLICADGGGSNGARNRAWKYHLGRLADEIGHPITVLHFPPGTSKWNKIEHRMFSHISINWRGKPLISYETIVNLIAGTRTKTGLKIKAKLDKRTYQAGVKISDEELARVLITRHRTHPLWNYTITPRPKPRARTPRAASTRS